MDVSIRARKQFKNSISSSICGFMLLLFASNLHAYALVGDGWDGVGQGSANINYYFGNLTTDNGLSASAIKSSFTTAFDAWSNATNNNLIFTEIFSPNQNSSIDISWLSGAHFGGNILAHAFYPSPPNPEPIAGDLHMNDAFSWEVGNGLGFAAYDIARVAVHEIGHSIGIGHSNVFGSVMLPTIGSSAVFSGLGQDDVNAVCALYDCSPQNVPEPSSLALLLFGLMSVRLISRRK